MFLAATLVLALVAASPALSVVIPFGGGSEPLSAIWLLGPTHMLEQRPSNIQANVTYSMFVGVDNHMGAPSYYAIYVKLRNRTQPLPDLQTAEPSPLDPLYEFRLCVADGATWESPLAFAFHNVSLQNNLAFVGAVTINNATFPVGSVSGWDPEDSVFFYELFFELYRYDVGSHDLQFHNRFAKQQLNATGS